MGRSGDRLGLGNEVRYAGDGRTNWEGGELDISLTNDSGMTWGIDFLEIIKGHRLLKHRRAHHENVNPAL